MSYQSNPKIIFSIIGLNLLLIFIGYLIGSLNTSIILSSKLKKDDVRNHFSQNAGATNSLRVYGKKFALTVFIIDFFKVIIPSLIFIILIRYVWYDFAKIYWMSPQAIGFGVIIGHCWPVFFKFKGGKGVACTSAFILVINPILWVFAGIIFFTFAFKTKKVSLSSICTASIILPFVFIPWFIQGMPGYWLNFVNYNNDISLNNLQPYWFVTGIFYLTSVIIIIFLHRSNIKRLLAGNESILSLKSAK